MSMFTQSSRFTLSVWLILLFSFYSCAASADNNKVDDPGEKLATDSNGDDKEYFIPTFDSSSCSIKTGPGTDDVINLKPLGRRDGYPRYNSTFDIAVEEKENIWNYSYNPCVPYSLPASNPHNKDIFGDGCHSVLMCKYSNENSRLYYYSLGISNEDNIRVEVIVSNETTTSPKVVLVYTGIKSMRAHETKLQLVCDHSRKGEDEGFFNIVLDSGHLVIYAELHHECCCVGGCWKRGLGKDATVGKRDRIGADGEVMLVIVGTLVAILMLVALIGGLCYVKRTHLHFYAKLPGINPTGLGANVSSRPHNLALLGTSLDGAKYSDFRDYEPAAVASARRKLIPILSDPNVQLNSVEMGQRLGGGVFGDTHLAKWNEMTVTLKRLTIAIHSNQLTSETMDWMKEEVWFLSRQRHRNIVCILGVCLDGRLPFLLTEYVIGECLKDFIKVNGRLLTWPQRIRLCGQVADGMAFLHSTKPPIIHRDLRCGNLFLSDNDLVKVADFGLTKLLQPMREQCQNDDCSCQRQLSACPAAIRWTSPELLTHPCTKEGESSIISTACDVYSFGMVIWEMVVCKDPFDEIATETEVIEIVRNGGRPEVPPAADMMPQLKDLMKNCWDQRPSFRPQFKQVAVKLKELVGTARTYQKHLANNKQRIQKDNEPV